MALFLARTFQKNFERLPKDSRDKIQSALLKLSSNSLIGKRLLGELDGELSMRVGQYRIIYFIDREKNVWVETVRHRKDAYKRQAK